MSRKENTVGENKFESLREEELSTVSGGNLFEDLQTMLDLCSKVNPERQYVSGLCSKCSQREDLIQSSTGKTKIYCKKVNRFIN